MCKPSKYINEICPSCHPIEYTKTLAEFTGESEVVDINGDADAAYIEYLYKCVKCGARLWVDEQWMKSHAVESTSVEVLHQRRLYISRKGRQLDTITDAHKYTRRLARIMRYHRILTDVEMAAVRKLIKGDGDR